MFSNKKLVCIICGYAAYTAYFSFTLTLSCKRNETGNVISQSRNFWIQNLSSGIDSNLYSSNAIDNINKLIDLLKAEVDNVPPILLDCSIHRNTSEDKYGLIVLYYDEAHIVSGFRVKEYKENNMRVDEYYTVYPGGRKHGYWVDEIAIHIYPRERDELKNDQLWDKYISREIIDRSALPPVLISIPTNDRKVVLSLVDINGRESNEIELSTSW